MRKIILMLCIVGICLYSSAQTWEEWTEQKRTALKRLREQIAANKVYIEYAQKGYRIVTDGLHTIRDIKNGDFVLHLGFIDSLKIVNPRLRNSVKVASIISAQLQILKASNQSLAAVRNSGQFTSDELDHCTRVFDNLLKECMADTDLLLLVVTHGQLSMSDDERLQRIDELYAVMQDKARFTASFSSEMKLLAVQRLNENTEIDYSKRLNGF